MDPAIGTDVSVKLSDALPFRATVVALSELGAVRVRKHGNGQLLWVRPHHCLPIPTAEPRPTR